MVLSTFIEKGVVDERVIQCLLSNEGFAPIEGELLDYKREPPQDAVALAKCAIQIVSLHNTFGGYLVFGVDEVSRDQRFNPCGVESGSVNVQQLRSLVRNYTGRTIDIVFADLSAHFRGSLLTLGLLFVPKRLAHLTPVQFGKHGPKRDDKPVFTVGDVFFRLQDTNARAQSSQDWWFLASERPNPHALRDTLAVPLVGSRKKIVDENLPDRNLICPKFVGREGVILELWHWLSDDFQYGKVLAGDGGKGKTSIAYEFAEEVCRSRPYDFEKVIWLTAKTKQFRGLKDDYDPVAAHYDSFQELLRALCDQLAVLPQEIEDSSPNLLKQVLRDAFSEIHTFVVVDDVDSLPPDEQRMVLELALQIGNSRSRFLLTTRKNFTYSADLSLTVQGFEKDDYTEYVVSLQERFGDIRLSRNSRDKSAVRWISAKLEEVGFTTWLDEKDIPPGQLFQDYIQKALPKAKAIAIIIGSSGLGRWQAFELRTAISSAVERGIPVIPVFLPDSKDVSADLPFLTEFNYVRFKAIDDPDALELLVWGVSHTTSNL